MHQPRLCNFEQLGRNDHGYSLRCRVCGFNLFSPSPAESTYAPCGEIEQPEPLKMPSLAARALHFAEAVAKHAADGFAKRSQDEVETLLAICRECPAFDGSHCTDCGCNCNDKGTFLNKLAWRSEHCPRGKW